MANNKIKNYAVLDTKTQQNKANKKIGTTRTKYIPERDPVLYAIKTVKIDHTTVTTSQGTTAVVRSGCWVGLVARLRTVQGCLGQ